MLDDDGVDFLGVRLAVVLIAAALLLSLAAVYVNGYVDNASRDRARQEARRIASVSAAEYASGATGSAAPIPVSIPDSVKRINFTGRSYSIEFLNGDREVYVADCRYSPVTLYPGGHRLLAEVIEDSGGHAISLREV